MKATFYSNPAEFKRIEKLLQFVARKEYQIGDYKSIS